MGYTYPDFARVISIYQEAGKRYSMEIELDSEGRKTFIVIQKNPSRANAEVSDHTINRVLNYLHRNRVKYPCLQGIQKVVFLNLIPWYQTYSHRLAEKLNDLSDPKNLSTIEAFLRTGDSCIIGWGNPPIGLKGPYDFLVNKVLTLLGKYSNPIYHVGELTRLAYPRHGQIWGYTDPLQNIK
jgi:hypothetical protein